MSGRKEEWHTGKVVGEIQLFLRQVYSVRCVHLGGVCDATEATPRVVVLADKRIFGSISVFRPRQ